MAANCVAANHAATVSIIKGDSAQRWLSELQLPARMVSKQGDVTYVSMWPVEC
jgi:thiamine biosynthesis lipoprotein